MGNRAGYGLLMNGADGVPEDRRDKMNSKISAAILMNVANGMSLKAAFDAVLGTGAYEKMAGQIYDALRAKAS